MPDKGLFQNVFTFNIMTPVASTGKPTSSGVLISSLAFCVWVLPSRLTPYRVGESGTEAAVSEFPRR